MTLSFYMLRRPDSVSYVNLGVKTISSRRAYTANHSGWHGRCAAVCYLWNRISGWFLTWLYTRLIDCLFVVLIAYWSDLNSCIQNTTFDCCWKNIQLVQVCISNPIEYTYARRWEPVQSNQCKRNQFIHV